MPAANPRTTVFSAKRPHLKENIKGMRLRIPLLFPGIRSPVQPSAPAVSAAIPEASFQSAESLAVV